MGPENRLSDNRFDTRYFNVDPASLSATSPGEVRDIILAQHDRIRRLLKSIEIRATRLLATSVPNASECEATRSLALVLCSVMISHVELENRILVTALEGVDAWGPVRAARLQAEHSEQLLLLRAFSQALEQESFSGAALALSAWQLVETISEDMEQEEASVLSSDLLVDYAIGSDVETG